MKSFNRAQRCDYEGEYMFIVRIRLGVEDNTIEIKDTVTMCKITNLKVEDESHFIVNF